MEPLPYKEESPMSGVRLVTWEGLTAGQPGARVDCPQFSHAAMQVEGIFGGACIMPFGTLRPQGTGDRLPDRDGDPMTLVLQSQISRIALPLWSCWPVVEGGDETTNLTVTLLLATPTEHATAKVPV